MRPSARDLVFFLGGRDLEMATIRALLDEAGAAYHDAGLAWGAKASAYRDEIAAVVRDGRTPVLVELADDLGLPSGTAIVVDHHGAAAGADRPTSLRQVFELLGLPDSRWDRRLRLVDANDRGHVAALVDAGATRAEVAAIRADDRAAQGITSDEEEAAQRAVAAARRHGRLTVVDLPHGRTAAVTDRLEVALGGPGADALLVLSPGEANFFGDGAVVERLAGAFPGSWTGGSLPSRGFWGHRPPPDRIEDLIAAWVAGTEPGDPAG